MPNRNFFSNKQNFKNEFNHKYLQKKHLKNTELKQIRFIKTYKTIYLTNLFKINHLSCVFIAHSKFFIIEFGPQVVPGHLSTLTIPRKK